jgi:predicted Zn-dependent protease
LILEFPYADLQISLDPKDKEKIFFLHPHFPDTGLYTYDSQILEHPTLRLRSNLKNQIQRATYVREGPSKHTILVYGVLGLIVAALLLVWLGNNAILGYVVRQLPPSFEDEIGKMVMADVKDEVDFVTDPKYLNYLSTVGKRLNASMPKGTKEFKYYVIDKRMVNAFAIPGGYVLVCRGLIDQVESPEELAGVLAHECAHLTEKHSMRKIAGTLGPGFAIHFFLGQKNSMLAGLAETAAYLGQQKYSRSQESEADDVGFDYLLKADIDPEGMIGFFKKMNAKELGFANPAFLSSHPPTRERLDRLEQRLNAMGKKKFKPFPALKKPDGAAE